MAFKSSSFLTLACVLMLAFYATPAMSCFCAYVEPKARYCKSDYVILANVQELNTEGRMKTYGIDIKETYKMTPEGDKALSSSQLTSLSDGECGIQLQTGKSYVIAGKGARLNVCYFYVKDHATMNTSEKNVFSGQFKDECK